MYLLTGATGFLGSHILLKLLQNGEQVRVVRRKSSSMHNLEKLFQKHDHHILLAKVEWIECDLLNPLDVKEAMNGITKVIHVAGFISFDPRDRQKLFDINMSGTANVVNAALQAGVEKFLYVSSIAALGGARDELMTEKNLWKNTPLNSNYGNSKYAGEREVWRGMEEGLDVLLVAPSVILGYGDASKGGPTICRTVKNGISYYPAGTNGFVGAEDVAKAIILLMNSEKVNEKYILSAKNFSHQEILSIIAKEVGSKAPTKMAKPWMLSLAWRWEWLSCRLMKRKARITRELANTMQVNMIYSGEKILEIEGFSYTPLPECIREMAGLCKNEG
ncbi:MAG: NAD-dependent epimerase/dehydratase family protein [Bacteroidota bacterium]